MGYHGHTDHEVMVAGTPRHPNAFDWRKGEAKKPPEKSGQSPPNRLHVPQIECSRCVNMENNHEVSDMSAFQRACLSDEPLNEWNPGCEDTGKPRA